MAKPTDDIEFATDGAALISDPGGTKKKLGFLVSEKPPAHWFDWLFRAYWRWISWLTTFTTRLQNSVGLNSVRIWTSQTATTTQNWLSTTWSPELGLFCAVASTGTAAQQIMTSPDGITWTPRTAPSAQSWQSICWSPELGLFCAVAATGTAAQQVMTSPDGITWTARTSTSVRQWIGVAWSPQLGLFCAVAVDGTAAQQIMTSPDGITWTPRTAPSAQSWQDVTWSPQLNLFCAVAGTGTAAQQIMTSPDGITWTARTAPSAQQWTSLSWSPELGLFCAVAQSGTAAQRIMTSPDGITWNARTAISTVAWAGIAWSTELGLFCAVATSGSTSQQVMTSPDGIKWTARITPSARPWQSVAWSPQLSLFCVVAFNDNQVMLSGLSSIRSIDVKGTTTNDDAPAGNIGEYIESTGASAALTSLTAKNIASLALTPGDWMVSGVLGLSAGTPPTTFAYFVGGVSTVSVTRPSTYKETSTLTPPTAGAAISFAVTPTRISLASAQTVYLVGQASFTGSLNGYGALYAWRFR